MHKCVTCQEEAKVRCKCNKKHYCDKDYKTHSQKKGKHSAVQLEESKEIKKAVSFAGSDSEKPKETGKEITTLEIEGSKKAQLKGFLEKELLTLQRFRLETQSCMLAQQSSLIKSIIEGSKKITTTIQEQCTEKEEMLEKTLEDINTVGKLPVGHSVIEKVRKSATGQSILTLEGSLNPISFPQDKVLEYKLNWTNNPLIDELKHYYEVNSTNIPPKLEKLYKKIFSEKHYSIKKITLNKAKIDAVSLPHFKNISNFFIQVKELNFASNKIPNENFELLAEALTSLRQIEKIDLSDNDLRGHGIEVLAPVLETYKSLTVLNLAKNSLGATGARHLYLMLENQKKLKELDLDLNNFGAEGARYLSMVLFKLNSLKTLKLRNNGFDDSSFKYFKNLLGKLPAIEVLKMENNKFNNDDKRMMQVIVRKECKVDI